MKNRLTPKQRTLLLKLPGPGSIGLWVASATIITADSLVRQGLAKRLDGNSGRGGACYVRVSQTAPDTNIVGDVVVNGSRRGRLRAIEACRDAGWGVNTCLVSEEWRFKRRIAEIRDTEIILTDVPPAGDKPRRERVKTLPSDVRSNEK